MTNSRFYYYTARNGLSFIAAPTLPADAEPLNRINGRRLKLLKQRFSYVVADCLTISMKPLQALTRRCHPLVASPTCFIGQRSRIDTYKS